MGGRLVPKDFVKIGGIMFGANDVKNQSVTANGKHRVELKSGQIFVFGEQPKTDIKMPPSIYSGTTSGMETSTDIMNCHDISVFGSKDSDRFRIFESEVKTLKLSGDGTQSADVVTDLVNSKIEHIDIDGNDYVPSNKNMVLMDKLSHYKTEPTE